jgi:TetR/AcrR family transcriptional regulator
VHDVSEKPAGKARLPGAERRKSIIQAAREVFTEHGFSGARTKQIAERAGVTEAFLYQHFESKEAMYETAILTPFSQALDELVTDVEQINAQYADPAEFVTALNKRCLKFYAEYSTFQTTALYYELGAGRALYTSRFQPKLERLGDLIARGSGWQDRGLDTKIVAQTLLGAQWAIGLDYGSRPELPDFEDAAAKLTRLFIGGVREKSATEAAPRRQRALGKPSAKS